MSWKRLEQGDISLKYETWLFFHKVRNRLRQSSSSQDNGQSMVIYHTCINHALSVVIVSWQRSEHSNISLMYETCSVSCHRLMTTDRALLFVIKVWNILRQLLSCHGNGQSMVIPPQIWVMLFQQQQNLGRRFGTSKIHLNPPRWLRMLSVLRRCFCCYWLFAYCYPHCGSL